MPQDAAREHERERRAELARPRRADACVVAETRAATVATIVARDRVARLRLVEHGVRERTSGLATPPGSPIRVKAWSSSSRPRSPTGRARDRGATSPGRAEHRRARLRRAPGSRARTRPCRRARTRGGTAPRGVAGSDRGVCPDHDRYADHRRRFRSASAPIASLTTRGVRPGARAAARAGPQEREVLRPVGTGEAEGRRGEIRRGARRRHRARPSRTRMDLVERRARAKLALWMSPQPPGADSDDGAVRARDERDRLRVAAVDAEQEAAHRRPSGRRAGDLAGSGRWAAASAS